MMKTGKRESRLRGLSVRSAGGLLLLLFLLLAPLAGISRAGDAAGEAPTVLEDVVVEGSAMNDDFRTGDVDPTQLTSFATVIDLEKVDPGIASLGDLLAKEVGVQVRSMGGIGSYSSVSLRGTSGDQVFVYLDGVLMNDASGGGVDLSMVPLNDIAAIEIYRGISPVNFARAGLGGVINIRTKRSRPGTSGSAGFGFGSFDTQRLFGSLSHQTENRYDLLAVGEYLGSDNDFKFWNDNGTEWNPADDRYEKRHNNELFRRSLLLKGGHDFSDDLRFELTEQYLNQDRRIPTWNNYPRATTHLHTERHQVTANFQADNRTPLHLNLSGIGFYSWKKELYSDVGGNIGLGRQRDRYKTEKYGGSLFCELPTEYQVLSLNCEAGRETYRSEDLLYSRPRGKSRRNYVSAAVQESLYLFGQRLLLTPAAHYQWYDDKLNSATSSYGIAIPGQSRKHDNLSPSIGLRLDLWGPFQLRANAAAYYREPSFYELFGDRGLMLGNPDLKAEKGQNYDLGLICDWAAPWSWLSHLELEGIVFYSKIKNLITQIYDARGVGRSDNIARARISGFEGRMRADLGPYFTLSGNGTWQNTTDRGEIDSFRNNELPGRWQRSFMGRFEGHAGGFRAYFEYLLSKDMYYDSANLLPADSKRQLNFGLTWTQALPTGELTLDFTVRNLNGNTYEDFNGYPMPRHEYYTNLTYRF
jgi:iron complex outermembrane receptor protein